MLGNMEKTDLDSISISGLLTKEIIQPKMNVDNDNLERVTDLELSLGYPNQCILRRLNNDPGAGANAGSRVDSFVATNPLSELVWSPHKGLSLKCAEGSLTEKKPSLLWGVETSHMVFSPPQSITARRTNNDKPIDEGNLITSQAILHGKSEVAERATLARSPRSNAGIMSICGSCHEYNTGTSGSMDEVNTAVELSVLDIDRRDNKGKDICAPIDIQTAAISETRENSYSNFPGQANGKTADTLSFKMDEPKPGMGQIEPLSGGLNKVIMSDPICGSGDAGSCNQILGMEVALAAEVHTMEHCKAPNAPVPNVTSPGRRHEDLASIIKEESKNKMKALDSTSAPSLEKLGFTAENYLWPLSSKNACGETSKIVVSESAYKVGNSSRQSEERLLSDKSVPVKTSPTNGRLRYQRKGKEKALSDGDVNERMSKEDDDSQESVESCNSAGLFSTGKKRWSFEQQLIVGSKRVKKQIQESPGSTSFVRQDSSFMNWISNMVKGLSKSNQDEAPSLALTLAHPNHVHESHDQKLITCSKNQDPGCRNMGFQRIFQSLYCPNMNVPKTRTLNGDYQSREGSKELEVANEICDISSTRINFRGENNRFCKQFLLSNEKFNQSTSADGEGPSTQPKISFSNFAVIQGNCKTNSAETKNLCNLACGVKTYGVSSSNSSLGKRKTNSAENNDSDPPSEGKAIHNVGYKSGPLGSLWITRFSQKTYGPVLNLDHCNHSTGGALKCSIDCARLIPHSQNHVDSSEDRKSLETREYSTKDPPDVVGKELHNCAANTWASFGFKRIEGHNDQKLINKLNPIFSSPKFKSLEAMASVFARRLDALKHITPLDNAARASTTCFFCGKRGHNLRDCPEVAETELEDLLRNMNSYDGADESHCLCIRCFQLNHWAVACPNASSRSQHQSDCGASTVNHCSLSKVHLNTGNERNLKPLGSKESQCQVAGAYAVCDGKNPRMDTDFNLNQKLDGMMTSDKRISNSSTVKKYISSSSTENELKENQITPLCNFVNRQISDVPKRMFEAIKKLRLSRTDILKWMDSHISLSHLDGFFLRLRLGKWEEGLGGTGYYVACITGPQRERSPHSSRNPISVNVGGIKCLVESQYVSNHDFLEDELVAWWCTTLKCGGKIPSEEQLKVKFEERKNLEF